MTYGRFTLEEWQERAGDPYLFENGRWYRITDHHVVVGLKQVNYQAEECDPREVERYLAEHQLDPVAGGMSLNLLAGSPSEASAISEEMLARLRPDTGSSGTAVTVSPGDVLGESGAHDEVAQAAPRVEAEPEQEPKEHWSSETFRNQQLPETERAQNRMTLSQYARLNGWTTGRISNTIKANYRKEYGDAG